MPVETMTPRERWRAVLDRRLPDRIPMDYWSTPEADDKLAKHLRVNSIDEARQQLHVDQPITVTGRYVGPALPPDTDPFGCTFREIKYETGVYGEVASHPLAAYETVDEIRRDYAWPSPDWYDYSHLPKEIAGKEDRPIRGGGSEPFLRYCYLRGLEQGMMDLVAAPDIVDYCLEVLFELAYQNTIRTYEAIPGQVMITYVAEDLGSQTDLLFSPEFIRRFLLPRMKRIMDLAHSAGACVFTHSDGAVRKIIPDLIDIGMDVLNPVQWRCAGMDREGLKKDFGDRVVFHAGVDNQYTIPFGTVEEVRQEVRDNLRILGDGGGYVLGPCHNIQSVGPAENVVAMYREGYESGWY